MDIDDNGMHPDEFRGVAHAQCRRRGIVQMHPYITTRTVAASITKPLTT